MRSSHTLLSLHPPTRNAKNSDGNGPGRPAVVPAPPVHGTRGARCAARLRASYQQTARTALRCTAHRSQRVRRVPRPRPLTRGRRGAPGPVCRCAERRAVRRRRGTGVYALPSRLTTFRESWAVAWDMANAVADPSTHLITPTCTASSSRDIRPVRGTRDARSRLRRDGLATV